MPTREHHIITQWLCLIAGAVSLLLTPIYSVFPLAVAAWFMPVFMLSFTRKITARWQWWIFWLVFAASFNVAMDGYTPFPIIYFFPASLVYASGWLLIYLLDHRLSKLSKNFWLTLFFPSGMVAYELLLDYLPSGNLMNFSHSQINVVELMQVTSLTGLWGVTFLINWTAAMIVGIVELRTTKASVLRPALILCFVLAAVFSAGYFRLSEAPHYEQTVRVAGVIEPGPATRTQEIYDRLTRDNRGRTTIALTFWVRQVSPLTYLEALGR